MVLYGFVVCSCVMWCGSVRCVAVRCCVVEWFCSVVLLCCVVGGFGNCEQVADKIETGLFVSSVFVEHDRIVLDRPRLIFAFVLIATDSLTPIVSKIHPDTVGFRY
jgi:hypothetical protein